jgi:flagellar biosynthesis protein FlhG
MPTLLAFASGRGGTGKTLLAANVAVYLAQIGKRVVVVDADPAGGTLHRSLGMERAPRGYGAFLKGAVETLAELVGDSPVSGVRVITGEGAAFGGPRPKRSPRVVLEALCEVEADFVVLDLGPPDSALTLDIWNGAQVPVLVTLPDPASVESTYRFMKSAFARLVRASRKLESLVPTLGVPPPSPLDLYRSVLRGPVTDAPAEEAFEIDDATASVATEEAKPVHKNTKGRGADPSVGPELATLLRAFRPRLVVSQTRALSDLKLGPWMTSAAHRRLGHGVDYLGHIEADDTVSLAAKRNRPLIAEYPEAKVCKNIERVVRRVLSGDSERTTTPPATLRLEEQQTHYEVLETEPGVSDEEIRRAYRTLKEIYAPGSVVVAGLYDAADLATLHQRITAAHDTLFSPERRRSYDLSLPEADLGRAVRAAASAPLRQAAKAVDERVEEGSGVVALAADEEVSGSVIRRIRESRGLELADIAHRTKISERHLRSIEDERFDELPAPVYVRGYVTQFARALRIDPTRAAESFMRRYRTANGSGAGTPVLRELEP